MNYILLIYLTLNPSLENEKTIEIKIPHESYENCIKASKKIDFKFIVPSLKFSFTAKCILNKNNNDNKNIET